MMISRWNDQENATAIAHRLFQERLTTEMMEGIFPEGVLPGRIDDILDIGCGPGGWGIDVAHSYPGCRVVGIDRNTAMITYAQNLLHMHHLQSAHFEVAPTYDRLPFQSHHFDFVNLPFGIGSVLPACGSLSLLECLRVLRSGGTLRLIEADLIGMTNSPAQMQFRRWYLRLLEQHEDGSSLTGALGGNCSWIEAQLRKIQCQTIAMQTITVDISYGTNYHKEYIQHLHMLWTQIASSMQAFASQDELERVSTQMLEEISSETLRGTISLSIIWSKRSETLLVHGE